MKKSIAFILAVCLAVMLSACKTENEGSALPSSSIPSSIAPSSSHEDSSSDKSSSSVSSSQTTIKETVLPAIHIDTSGEEIPIDKTAINCSVTLSEDGKTLSAPLNATIRVRGNGSLNVAKEFGKYPYKIKFSEKINLFGIGDGKSKDWVLLANRDDRTMLRNYAAKTLGKLLDGITWSPAVCFVDLYIGGDYAGVYELSQQVEVSSHKLPVNDSLTLGENGFLAELDYYAKTPDEDDITFTVGKSYYTVKSRVQNDSQLTFIKEYIAEVEEAIFAHDIQKLSKLVDMDSLVDMYLIQEFSKNIDCGFSSFYMYKNPDEKLYFSAPWDFDLAFGNDRRLDDGSAKNLYIATGRKGFIQNHLWYMELWKTDSFKALAAARWKELSGKEIPQLISLVAHKAEELSIPMERNFMVWPSFGERLHHEPDHLLEFLTYKEHADHLISWMKTRKAFLDNAFKDIN